LTTQHIIVVRRSQAWVATNDALWRTGVPIPEFRWITWDGAIPLPVLAAYTMAGLLAGVVVLASATSICSRHRPQTWLRFLAVVLALIGVAARELWSISSVPEATPGAWPTLSYDKIDLSLTLGSLIFLVAVVYGLIGPLGRAPVVPLVTPRQEHP
jgi:hypothetical protein